MRQSFDGEHEAVAPRGAADASPPPPERPRRSWVAALLERALTVEMLAVVGLVLLTYGLMVA